MEEIELTEAPAVSYIRQLGMFDPSLYQDRVITIVGLGNIGSHTALALARMGLRNFELYDFDRIESHNLSSQAYKVADIGKLKTAATAEAMRELNPEAQITIHSEEFRGARGVDILVSAVDSLEARRTIAANIDAQTRVVDGRMGGGQIEVHTQRGSEWAATIPAEADTDPCGARYISYTSYLIAGLIANNVKRILRNEPVKARILMHADTLQIIV